MRRIDFLITPSLVEKPAPSITETRFWPAICTAKSCDPPRIGRMDPRPIGVFDSGTGGLTVLHECLVTMPHEDFVYLGDHARLPYGPRPLDEIRGFALEIGRFLEGR